MENICKVENCIDKVYGKGWCTKHYTRWRRHGDPSFESRNSGKSDNFTRFNFYGWKEEQRVEGLSQCWVWQGNTFVTGYGVLRDSKGIQQKAHRISYQIFKGDIPPGAHILHSCDQRDCVNPEHLSAGDRSRNMQEMWDRKRHRKMFGESHPAAKITDVQVNEIKELRKMGETIADISSKYNLGTSQVWRITRGMSRNL